MVFSKRKYTKTGAKKYIVFLTILVLICLSFCQTSEKIGDRVEPSDVEEILLTEFQELLVNTQKDFFIPGLAGVAVTSKGIIWKGVSGVRRLGSSESITLQDRFHIGSNTKAMTGFMAGTLVEQKLIDWETKILDVFPQYRPEANKAYFAATLRDVLSHRAGILPFKHAADFERLPDFSGSDSEIREAFAAWLFKQKPVAMEAQGFTYSNAGYTVAAAALEKVSGKSWEQLIKEDLFKPLGIDGRNGWPAFEDEEQPWGHWMEDGKLQPHDPHGEYQLPGILAPAGDINMSVLDYAKYLQTLLSGISGEDTIIRSSTCHFLLYTNIDFSPYSIGWGSSKRNGLTISSHDGSAGTFYCHAFIVKELDLAIALMANSATQETVRGLHSLREKIVKLYQSVR